MDAPPLIYGTAWKEGETARLTRLALDAGFRGIDTANQRRHYFEEGVGEAIAGFARGELFLQTKFTSVDGQDHRLPYDPRAPLAQQVEQSFASSLEHLGTDYLDAYVLHGPSRRDALGDEDWETWEAMEALHRAGKTKRLGISNCSLRQVEELLARARVKPAIVQNRCYASRGWDRPVRELCKKNGIAYQAFSLLTANPEVLRHSRTAQIASRVKRTPQEVIFRFAIDAGMTPLTGTKSKEHMKQDLSVVDFALEPAEIRDLDTLVG